MNYHYLTKLANKGWFDFEFKTHCWNDEISELKITEHSFVYLIICGDNSLNRL